MRMMAQRQTRFRPCLWDQWSRLVSIASRSIITVSCALWRLCTACHMLARVRMSLPLPISGNRCFGMYWGLFMATAIFGRDDQEVRKKVDLNGRKVEELRGAGLFVGTTSEIV